MFVCLLKGHTNLNQPLREEGGITERCQLHFVIRYVRCSGKVTVFLACFRKKKKKYANILRSTNINRYTHMQQYPGSIKRKLSSEQHVPATIFFFSKPSSYQCSTEHHMLRQAQQQSNDAADSSPSGYSRHGDADAIGDDSVYTPTKSYPPPPPRFKNFHTSHFFSVLRSISLSHPPPLNTYSNKHSLFFSGPLSERA